MAKDIEIKRLPDKEKIVKERYVEIGGYKFNESIVGLLENLKDTDGFFEALNIRSEDVGKALVGLGLAHKSVRGSYSVVDKEAKAKIKKILDKLYDMFYD